MAVKGQTLKNEITQKILATFKGSFLYNDGKEIRINGSEDGNPIQIKITLTCAKTPVEFDTDDLEAADPATSFAEKNEKIPNEPSEEEKERLEKLLSRLNLT